MTRKSGFRATKLRDQLSSLWQHGSHEIEQVRGFIEVFGHPQQIRARELHIDSADGIAPRAHGDERFPIRLPTPRRFVPLVVDQSSWSNDLDRHAKLLTQVQCQLLRFELTPHVRPRFARLAVKRTVVSDMPHSTAWGRE